MFVWRFLWLMWVAVWLLSRPGIAQQQRFVFPVKPGQPASLTGNMGELRTNHFHGGLDVRTGYTTGWPIHASADGYISYVQISSHGYGYMLHVKHPSGLVTVYAHLERFMPEVQTYARDAQREQDVFEVELYPSPGRFKVKQGEVIGWSGNTGSSGGPHLHYEIRDTSDVVLNPLHFGFTEITDKLAPYVSGLAVKTFGINSRVNGQPGRVRVPVRHMGGHRYKADHFRAGGAFGFEILARDRINNGTQHTGISCMEVVVDGKEMYYLNIERFPFNQTGHINVHINYEVFKQTGERFQKCYLDDGNAMIIGRPGDRKGQLLVTDSAEHRYQITVYDAYQNTCMLEGTFTGDPDKVFLTQPSYGSGKPSLRYSIDNRLLRLEASGPAAFLNSMTLYSRGRGYRLYPRAVAGERTVYLYDMAVGLPDSVAGGGARFVFAFLGVARSQQADTLRGAGYAICFRRATLFDTSYIELQGDPPSGSFELGDPTQPLFTFFDVRVKVAKPLTAQHAFYLASGGKLKWLRSTVRGDTMNFEAKYFGRFVLLKDSTPPLARLVLASARGLRVIIGDNLSGIRDFHAYMNDKPLALEYDHKRNLVWADADEMDIAGKGKLVFVVRDNAGNEKRFESTIL